MMMMMEKYLQLCLCSSAEKISNRLMHHGLDTSGVAAREVKHGYVSAMHATK